MSIKKRFLSKIQSESFLIGILHLIGLLCLYNDSDHKRGRPYVYPTTVILRCLVVRIWMRIPSNNALHYCLSTGTPHSRKVMSYCGLHTLPDRRTFDRRFKVVPVQNIITSMGLLFIKEGFVEKDTSAADSAIIQCKKIWHKSDMKKNRIPVSGIDTDARWGFSKTRGWVFGYKLHMSCSTGKIAVPLTACVSTANIYDPHMYEVLIEPLVNLVRHVAADSIYSGRKQYDYSESKGIILVCPIKRYRHTKGERLKRYHLFRSRNGQRVIRKRGAIERMFDRVKDTFGISPVPVRGYPNVSSYVLGCVFVYQIAIYYNCMIGETRPQCVKHMIGI